MCESADICALISHKIHWRIWIKDSPKAIKSHQNHMKQHQNQPSRSLIIAAVEALIMASLSVLLAWLEDSTGRFLGEAVDFHVEVEAAKMAGGK